MNENQACSQATRALGKDASTWFVGSPGAIRAHPSGKPSQVRDRWVGIGVKHRAIGDHQEDTDLRGPREPRQGPWGPREGEKPGKPPEVRTRAAFYWCCRKGIRGEVMHRAAPGKPSPLQGRALRTHPAPARSSGAPSSRCAARGTPVLPLPFFMTVFIWYVISFFGKLSTRV